MTFMNYTITIFYIIIIMKQNNKKKKNNNNNYKFEGKGDMN